MFKKLFISILGLSIMLGICVMHISKKEEVKAEIITNENLNHVLVNGLNGKSKVITVTSDKLKEFNLNEMAIKNLNRKVLLDYDGAIKRSKLKNEKVQVSISKSKDLKYVSVKYKLTNSKNKKFTTLSYILDVKKQKIVQPSELLKNAKSFKSKVATEWSKDLKVSKQSLLTVPTRLTQPIQFSFDTDGNLTCHLDVMNVRPKVSTSGITLVSNSKAVLNKKEVKVIVPSKLIK